MRAEFSRRTTAVFLGALALWLGGCGTLSMGVQHDVPPDTVRALVATPLVMSDAAVATEPASPAVSPSEQDRDLSDVVASVTAPAADEQGTSSAALEHDPFDQAGAAATAEKTPALAVAQKTDADNPEPDVIEEYDPWEPFNEKVFTFNYNFDKYVIKPVAKGYNFVVPDRIQQMIGNGFNNIKVVPRLVNTILQWNWKGFGAELGRFLINSTLGIGGLFDIAKQEFRLEPPRGADFGVTLGKWGVGPGPYLILPLTTPLTLRDGIGTGVDGAMDPLGYVLPFFWDRFAMKVTETINDRSLNLDLFQGFEETTVDLYTAVRNGYLQRRYHRVHDQP